MSVNIDTCIYRLGDYFSSPEPLGDFQLDLAQKKGFQIWLNGRQYPLDINTTLQSYSLYSVYHLSQLKKVKSLFAFITRKCSKKKGLQHKYIYKC